MITKLWGAMRHFAALSRQVCLIAAACLPSLTALGDLQLGSSSPIREAPPPSWEPAPPFSAPPPAEPVFPVPANGLIIDSQPLVSDSVYRNRVWRADVGVMPGGTLHVTDVFANWPHGPIFGMSFTAGYETNVGWGTRFRLSVLGLVARVNGDPLELIAVSGSVD